MDTFPSISTRMGGSSFTINQFCMPIASDPLERHPLRLPSTIQSRCRPRIEESFIQLLSLREETNRHVKIAVKQKKSSSILPNRWDVYPWHGYYCDKSSVQTNNHSTGKSSQTAYSSSCNKRRTRTVTPASKRDEQQRPIPSRASLLSKRAQPIGFAIQYSGSKATKSL